MKLIQIKFSCCSNFRIHATSEFTNEIHGLVRCQHVSPTLFIHSCRGPIKFNVNISVRTLPLLVQHFQNTINAVYMLVIFSLASCVRHASVRIKFLLNRGYLNPTGSNLPYITANSILAFICDSNYPREDVLLLPDGFGIERVRRPTKDARGVVQVASRNICCIIIGFQPSMIPESITVYE